MSKNKEIKDLINKSEDKIIKNDTTFLAFDGIVNEIEFEKSKLKIAYLLKEVNAPEMKENWDFISTLYKHANSEEPLYKTWPNVCMWTAILMDECKFYQECIDTKNGKFNESKYRKYLNYIAVVNLKKTPGVGSSKYEQLTNAVLDYGELTKKELSIINPNLVICGGTFEFAKMIYKIGNDEIKRLQNGVEYFIKDKTIFLEFIHPMWYQVNRKILFSYAKETFTLFKNKFMIGKYINDKNINNYDEIDSAAEVIKNGGLVLFPTETVYGIGANAFDDEAVKKIFVAKGRAQDNPLILHISNMEMLEEIAEDISELEYKLMETFWPGPFTIILNNKANIANEATCKGDTVGVRMPSNRIAYELIKRANVPIAAPSANVSGKPSGTNINDIIEELENKVDYIINGGDSEIGLESTVVRVIDNEVIILRPGKITKEDISKITEYVEIDKKVMEHIEKNEKVLSPGMKYRHYAPKTHCTLVYSSDNDKVVSEILNIADTNKKVLILSTEENLEKFNKYKCINLGSKKNLLEISHNLFSILRSVDSYNVDLAIIEGIEPEGIGLAIMNRLIRACEYDYRIV